MDSKLLKERAKFVKEWKKLNKTRKKLIDQLWENGKELSLIEGAIFSIDAHL